VSLPDGGEQNVQGNEHVILAPKTFGFFIQVLSYSYQVRNQFAKIVITP